MGTMLRKACVSARKDQPMPESGGTSFFSLPGLLVGFTKGMADADSAGSPTSPLDCRLFSGFGSHFARSPRSPGAADAARKSWDCDRVGLGLVDSLSDGGETCRSVFLGSPENRKILLGSQTRINIPCPKSRLDRLLADSSATSPKSLPKNYVISSNNRNASPCFKPVSPEKGERASVARFELGELGKIQSCCSPHIDRSPSHISEARHSESKNASLISPPFAGGTKFESCSGSLPDAYGFLGSLSASDIEQSEDYTCIISHGPNPKTTRIFGDCILESRRTGDTYGCSDRDQWGEEGKGCLWTVMCLENPMSFPSEDFLRVCFSCQKKLEGEDIYVYRGEKAFCSSSCRSQEIMFDEEMEGLAMDSSILSHTDNLL
ncbi:hypothetical protein Taro_050956 [Colocasia esculenta]|uniref:FLZ-type domain-containing protein n=1 Tax=Colocasia esculenta TaxID=4460 RepID=A0A843XFC9_COLES|nr:hypothetical protein [Colocasia esculenta]